MGVGVYEGFRDGIFLREEFGNGFAERWAEYLALVGLFIKVDLLYKTLRYVIFFYVSCGGEGYLYG